LIALLYRGLGVKFVFDHHDLAPEPYLSKYGSRKSVFYHVLRWMERLSCWTAHAVVSTNQSYKRHVIERHRIDPRKVFVVRNDPEVTREPTLSLRRNAPERSYTRLLYLGAINTQDGVDLLVRSLHILVHELGERYIRCDILGDGDDLQRVRDVTNRLGMDPYLHFAGFVRDKKAILAHIRRADICLESAPLNPVNTKSTFIKVMEYMSLSKPIVAFDLPETRYSTGGAALLVPPNDLRQFALAIRTLIRDPARRADLGRAGRQRIVSELNWERSSECLSRTYSFLLD
jgi:glycosyltransferase involved in cell wall biosynthesis